jgi:teichoic acid transport system permease protein
VGKKEVFIRRLGIIASIPMELYRNRRLIARLAFNDFKTRYAGSFFGMFWAFVQPVVTILVFWFVFEHGLRGCFDFGVYFCYFPFSYITNL